MSETYRARLRTGSEWRGSLPDQVTPPPSCFCCAAGESFAAWCGQLRARVESIKTDKAVGIRQAKLLLLDRWFSVRALLPKAHRDRIANRSGAPCTYGVFLETLTWLLEMEQSIAPPALAAPPKIPRERTTSGAGGIFLGEIEREQHR